MFKVHTNSVGIGHISAATEDILFLKQPFYKMGWWIITDDVVGFDFKHPYL